MLGEGIFQIEEKLKCKGFLVGIRLVGLRKSEEDSTVRNGDKVVGQEVRKIMEFRFQYIIV